MKRHEWAVGLAVLLCAAACGGSGHQDHASSAANAVGTTTTTSASAPVATSTSTAGRIDRTRWGADAPTGSVPRLPQSMIAHAAPVAMQSPSEWKTRYPFAASELVVWSKQHAALTDALAAWEDREPDKSRALVEWAVTHVYEGIGAFLMERYGWDDLRDIRQTDPDGFDAFLSWCRRAPQAAEELVTSTPGIGTAVALRGAKR